MGDRTGIQWTDATWNPVTGCSKVSAGCRNCYAEKVAERFWGDRKFTQIQTHLDRLDQPSRWRQPRRVFVNSMSDLFHDAVPDWFVQAVFTTMAVAKHHKFQVLTKRPERMLDLMAQWQRDGLTLRDGYGCVLPNVWLGVSVEDQRSADIRIPILLQTPAAVRFVSAEPLLGPVDLRRWFPVPMFHCAECGRELMKSHCRKCGTEGNTASNELIGVDWVIVGGESGPGARPCDVEWVRSLVEQCKAASEPCFVKQLGSYAILDPRYDRSIPAWSRKLRDAKGADMSEWPEDLRVRQFPKEVGRG